MVKVPQPPSEIAGSPIVMDMLTPPDRRATSTSAPAQCAAGRASKLRYGLAVKVKPHEFHSENSSVMRSFAVSDAVPGSDSETGRCTCTSCVPDRSLQPATWS
jgi:hypothetical protein